MLGRVNNKNLQWISNLFIYFICGWWRVFKLEIMVLMVKWRPRLHIFVVRNSVMTIKRLTSPFSCVIYQLTQPQVANQQKRKKKFLEHSNLEMPSLMYNLSLAHQSNLREKIYQISHIFKNSIENEVNFDDGWVWIPKPTIVPSKIIYRTNFRIWIAGLWFTKQALRSNGMLKFFWWSTVGLFSSS